MQWVGSKRRNPSQQKKKNVESTVARVELTWSRLLFRAQTRGMT